MKRRLRRELNAVISKVLNPESDIELEERWLIDKDKRTGTFTLQIVGKPITVTAEFELVPDGKGCVYGSSTRPRCGFRSLAAWSRSSSSARPSRAVPTSSTIWPTT